MKKILFALLAVMSLLFSSCETTVYRWEFYQDGSQVDGAYIVNANSPEDYEIIKEISPKLLNQLMEDIKSIEYKKYGWNLHETNGKCFVIKFVSGEYDIISWYEPMHFILNDNQGDKALEEELKGIMSWLKCDKEVFDNLIEQYLNAEPTTDPGNLGVLP